MAHFPWIDFQQCGLWYEPFKVTNLADNIFKLPVQILVFEQILHNILTFLYSTKVFKGQGKPSFKQPAAHGSFSVIEYGYERSSIGLIGWKDFKVLDGKLVKPYIFVFFDPAYFINVLQVVLLCLRKIMEHNTGSADGHFHFTNTKSFEVGCSEMIQKFFVSIVKSIKPFLEQKCIVTVAKYFLVLILFCFWINYFLLSIK